MIRKYSIFSFINNLNTMSSLFFFMPLYVLYILCTFRHPPTHLIKSPLSVCARKIRDKGQKREKYDFNSCFRNKNV